LWAQMSGKFWDLMGRIIEYMATIYIKLRKERSDGIQI